VFKKIYQISRQDVDKGTGLPT